MSDEHKRIVADFRKEYPLTSKGISDYGILCLLVDFKRVVK